MTDEFAQKVRNLRKEQKVKAIMDEVAKELEVNRI